MNDSDLGIKEASTESVKPTGRKAHTPGPWEVKRYSDDVIGVRQSGDLRFAICNMIGDECDEANANIIAAAPELLEALKNIAEPIPFGEPGHIDLVIAWKQAHEAIAKAEGWQGSVFLSLP